jgi:hypothetical protein
MFFFSKQATAKIQSHRGLEFEKEEKEAAN